MSPPQAFALGIIAAYILPMALLAVVSGLCWWRDRKERKAEVNRLLADKAITEMENRWQT